jgi:hypothetical protein
VQFVSARYEWSAAEKSSTPGRQNRFRFHDLFGRAGEGEFEFSRPAGDENFDGVQAAGDHPEAELLVDFPESVLLEAIAHASVSVRDGLIAMFNAGYFGGCPPQAGLSAMA